MSQPRPQLCVTVSPQVIDALRKRAQLSGLPVSRVADAALARGLGVQELPPPLPPRSEAPTAA